MGAPILLVLNVGSRRGSQVSTSVVGRLKRAGIPFTPWWIFQEPPPESAKDLGEAWIVGGDGTVSHAVDTILPLRSMRIGLVPSGTGNNIAQNLRVPLDWRDAVARLLGEPTPRAIDLIRVECDGRIHRRHAVLVGAFGFPVDVIDRFARVRALPLARWVLAPLGESIYRILGAFEVMRGAPKGRPVDLTLGGETHRFQATAVFVGNDRGIGGQFIPCPRARWDDGILDIAIFSGPAGRMEVIDIMRRIRRGEDLGDHPLVAYFSTGGPFDLSFPDGAVDLETDGDIVARGSRYRFQVLPGALSVLV